MGLALDKLLKLGQTLAGALTMPLHLKSHLYLSRIRHSQWSLSFSSLSQAPNYLNLDWC